MKGDVVMSNDVKNSQMVGQPADHGLNGKLVFLAELASLAA